MNLQKVMQEEQDGITEQMTKKTFTVTPPMREKGTMAHQRTTRRRTEVYYESLHKKEKENNP